jgi:hypothetical protein
MSDYLIPTISSLPLGFDCVLPISADAVTRRLVGDGGRVRHRLRVFHDGEISTEESRYFDIHDGRTVGPWTEAYRWRDRGAAVDENPGFLESEFRVEKGDIRFTGNTPLSFYSIYSASGKKGFLSDNAYKFSSPPIISQIAAYGRFVDTYPVIRLDRERDYGDSLFLINPYNKPILCSVITMDGRKLPRFRVPALSARYLSLENLLKENETAWVGEIQLTANNRLITYDIKHALSDIRIISDHEHLDPFRGDPTHLPFFQRCRSSVGDMLSRRFASRHGR